MENIFLQLIEISITTSIMIFILVALSPVLNKRYAAKWKYWMWLILAVRLLLPINFTSSHLLIEISVPQGWQKAIVENRNILLSENAFVSGANRDISDFVNQSAADLSLDNHVGSNGIQGDMAAKEAAKDNQTIGIYENNIKMPEGEQLQNNAEKNAGFNIVDEMIKKLYSVTFLDVFCGIWIIGMVCFVLYHSMSYSVYKKKLLRFCRPCGNKECLALYKKLCKKMYIFKKPVILVSSKAQSPMLTGLIRPKLILPDMDYSLYELYFILSHELMHYKRKDLWYKLLLLCVNAVHWFNPFVYLMFREASGDLERFCDDAVMEGASFAKRRAYTEAILNNLIRQKMNEKNLSTYFYGGSRRMKNRFQNILNTNEKKKGRMAFVLLLCSFLIISSMIACGSADENKIIVENDENNTDASPITDSSVQPESTLENLEVLKAQEEALKAQEEAMKAKEEALKTQEQDLMEEIIFKQIEESQLTLAELEKLKEIGQFTEENKREMYQVKSLIELYESELQKLQQEKENVGKIKRDKRYTLYENDFISFYCPSVWDDNVEQSEDMNRIVFSNSETSINEEKFWIQHGEAWLVDLNITAESYEEMWKETYPDIQVIRISNIFIDDYEAIEIVFSYTKDGKRYYGVDYQTIVGYASYQFHGSCLKTGEEDFKRAISSIINSINFLTEDSSDDAFDKIELYMAKQSLSGDALEVQQLVKDFSKCFFQGDLDGVKQYLWENFEWDVYVNEAVDMTTFDLKKIKGLTYISEQAAGDECHVSLEYIQGSDDSCNYLEIWMIKTEGGWKITSYGVEK